MAFQTGGEIKQGFQSGGEIQPPQLSFPSAGQDPSSIAPQFQESEAIGLLRNLGGTVPVSNQEFNRLLLSEQGARKVRSKPGVLGAGPSRDLAAIQTSVRSERKRREAFRRLTDPKGKFKVSPQGVADALVFQRGTKEPSIVPQIAGAALGSIGTAAVLGRVLPGPIDDIGIFLASLKTGLQATGAGSGAVTARAIQAGLDPDDETNKMELLKIFGIEGATEIGAIGLTRVLKNMFRSGIRGAAIDAKELSQILTRKAQQATPGIRKNVGLLPGQIAPDQPAAKGLDSIISKGFLSQKADAQFRILQKKGAQVAGDTLLDNFLPSVKSLNPDQAFSVLSDVMKHNRRVPELMAAAIYDKVDAGVAAATKISRVTKQIPTKILDASGKPLTRKAIKTVVTPLAVDISNLSKTTAIDLELISNAIGADHPKLKLLKDVISKGDNITFSTTQESITNMNEIIRSSGELFTKNRRLSAAAIKIKKGLEIARDRALDKLPGDLKVMAKRARTIWRTTSDRFDKPVLQQLFNAMEKDPVALDRFMSSQELPNIKSLKKVIGNDAFDRVSKNWAEGMVKNAGTIDAGLTTEGKGVLMGESILEKLNDNEPVARFVLGNTEFETMRKTARAINLIQKTDTQGVAAFRMIQVGSMMALVGGGFGAERAGLGSGRELGLIAAGTILIGPRMLGILSRQPWFAQALTKGLNIGPASKEAIQISARLIRGVNAARRQVNREDAKLQKEASRRETFRNVPPAREFSGFGGRGR